MDKIENGGPAVPSPGFQPRAATASDAALGQNLRRLRRSRSLTQGKLGAMVGVSAITIHRYETGSMRIAASRLVALAKALGMRPDSLISSCTTEPEPAQIDSAVNAMRGTTLRDHFAGQALAGMGMWSPTHPNDYESKARWAYAQADAMIAARKHRL